MALAGWLASGASLLLNTEGVFTALLAWFVFRENFDRRIALGMVAIVAGTVVLSCPGEVRFSIAWPALAIVGACLAWGIDNNLTRKVSLSDATWIAAIKGLMAGGVNLTLAFLLGAKWPLLPNLVGAMLVGWLAYGVSLALFVVSLRHLGTARTGAYFSVAPFFGAVLALPLLGESVSPRLLLAGSLMALGVWLHLTERHPHEHTHEPIEHEHDHIHDAHHQHEHDESGPSGPEAPAPAPAPARAADPQPRASPGCASSPQPLRLNAFSNPLCGHGSGDATPGVEWGHRPWLGTQTLETAELHQRDPNYL
jgi:multidrug transporter EmrE-like cation transporter